MAEKSALPILLTRTRPKVEAAIADSSIHRDSVVLFFSITDGRKRAEVITAAGLNFASAWKLGVQRVYRMAAEKKMSVRWLRIDWVCDVERVTWRELQTRFIAVKRNYFRQGISLDSNFKFAFLEMELNANAMLYGGGDIVHAVLNKNNFRRYALLKFGINNLDFLDDGEVYVFSTQGAFAEIGSPEIHLISGSALNAGRRDINYITSDGVFSLIKSGSDYLAKQVKTDGCFHYGWFPCFDREIEQYNSLRHASTLYSMLEAWEVTRDVHLKTSIERAVDYLTETLIKTMVMDGEVVAFLIDSITKRRDGVIIDVIEGKVSGESNDEISEIKLGGNAVCILALVKYTELMGTSKYIDVINALAFGILFMQDKESGKFVHVLSFPSLSVKEEFRIIYYDGEAAFALMRLYGLTKDPRWLAAVENAFSYFISAGHWKAHDHWLSYAINELTRYRPSERYYQFGIRNFIGHLDFVTNRITTFPTLLELMMAAQQMIFRLEQELQFRHLIDGIDLQKFYHALHTRAYYLINGHFWPELAMFFANPARINGSFFIRHHGFRVRIDDVEHYLSGFVAYLKYLQVLRGEQGPDLDALVVAS